MQLEAFQSTIDIILLEALLAFMVLVSVGFYRFARRTKFRIWAIGWIVYILLGALGILNRQPIVSPVDILAIGGMFVGALIIVDASRGVSDLRQHSQRYLVTGMVGALFALLCFLGQAPASIGFMPPAFLMVYACFVTAKDLMMIEIQPRAGVWAAVFGLLIVAGSFLLLPLDLILPLHEPLLLAEASGVIITGAAMFTLMVRLMRRDLRTQIQISHLMASVLQHDIRNYIHVAKAALELSESPSEDGAHWQRIALDALTNAQAFVDDMKDISGTLSSQESRLVPTIIDSIVGDVLQRVRDEYNLDQKQIDVDIPTEIVVYSNGLLRELLWNIIDNAFKHGSQTLTVHGTKHPTGPCTLAIGDAAGGLPSLLKDFFNTQNNGDLPRTPSNGLGIGLIKGLAPLCGVRISVFDRREGSELLGTVFHLEFECAKLGQQPERQVASSRSH
ncbi:MAG: sensor histidine kinase [Candidatus Thorarchaeota archaeon]|jgi:signal transduction histidine kinase